MGWHWSRGAAVLALALFVVMPPATFPPLDHALSAPPVVVNTSLSSHLPEGTPPAEELARWEQIRGDLEMEGGEGVIYVFYVNPKLQGLYQIRHYRFWSRRDGKVTEEPERLLWSADPGKEPVRAYELVDGAWVQLAHRSPAYRREMQRSLYLLGLHRKASGLGAF